MSDTSAPDRETARLGRLYDSLRERLLDLSRRNPMLSYRHQPRSRRQLQIVDEVPEAVYRRLALEGKALDVVGLPEPDATPADERTEEFLAALDHARVSDVEHLTKLEALDAAARDDEGALARLDRELRDRVRASLGLPPRPDLKSLDLVAHARANGIDPAPELQAASSRDAHGDGRLQTLLLPDDLEARLEKIADGARLAEQEMGLSTLFLAFGFLEWFDREDAERASFAPLLLLPVRLGARRVRGRKVFSLQALGEAADHNVTLQRFLEKTRGRKLPDFAGDPEDAASVEAYFAAVTEAVEGLKGWRVRRFLTLGHFAFGRLAMYEDLNPENWGAHPASQSLVEAILRGTDGAGEATLPAMPEDYPVDDPEVEAAAPLLIHDADASQHSAVIDAMRGVNLVVQGPPGTGKSQTIVNVIANAMAQGRTVLFLAEKLAALEVVKRRLDQAALGEFCLELHSDKASARHVVERLKARAGLDRTPPAPTARLDARGWSEARREIGEYLQALHAPRADGETGFRLLWGAVAARDGAGGALDAFRGAALPEALLADADEARAVLNRVRVHGEALAAFAGQFGPFPASPWRGIAFRDTPAFAARDVLDRIEALVPPARALEEAAGTLGDPAWAIPERVRALPGIVEALGEPPDLAGAEEVLAGDAAALGSAVRDQRSLLLLEAGLAAQARQEPGLPLAELPDALLDLAARARQGLDPDLAGLPPARARQAAREAAEAADALVAAVEAFRPALALLDVEGAELAVVRGASLAAVMAGAIDPALRPWLAWQPSGREDGFEAAYERWRGLVEDEADWRERVPAYDPARRPRPLALEEAAAMLERTGLSRFLASWRGHVAAAEAVAEGLRLPESGRVDTLRALAAHIRTLENFEANRAFGALIGPVWAGLATPFPALRTALGARRLLGERLKGEARGARIAESFLALAPDAMGELAGQGAQARAAARLLEAAPAAAKALPLPEALDALRRRAEAARRFAGLDPDGLLDPFPQAIERLSGLADLERRRRVLAERLAAHPLRDVLDRHAATRAGLDRLDALIAWSARVREADLPDPMKARLLSPEGAAARDRLRHAAEAAAGALAALEAGTEALDREFGVSGLLASEGSLRARLDALLERRGEARDAIELHAQRADLVAAGLGPVLERADALAPGDLAAVVEGLLVQGRAAALRAADPALARASGSSLDGWRRTFAGQDRLKIAGDRAAVRARLLERKAAPGSDRGPRRDWTEMALLRNEFGKQKAYTPVRSLLARAPLSVQALTPCFMMSPLSLAKFLPRGGMSFDLVVIDEASQMRPEDALGALLRAGQIVVVGDTKQLPPTDFFLRAADGAPEDEDADDVDDESILEGCLRTFRGVRGLKWHYRSRCESLIAFSNRHFYDSGLITFPQARPGSFSVDLVRVEGAYQARRNALEARRVAEEAANFMRAHADDPEDALPTLGIVALNTEQRDLVFEELRRLQAGDPEVERYREKAAARAEDLFVKNLENVQGDERDVIFISLTYGPDAATGAVMQRFGPINGRQGHRRLNVLFSRARRRVALFASMGSADVKPSETSARGVHVLKAYLEYAERRSLAPAEATGREPDSDFEVAVKRRLEDRGFRVDPQVGVSGFRIDLGVRHPDHPEAYLAGIECDGARYHASRSARDRDRLREEVLRGLGWRILRVWSTDWFDDPDGRADRLAGQLEQLRAATREEFGRDRTIRVGAEPAADAAGEGAAPAEGVEPAPLAEARAALEEFRRSTIEVEFPGSEPGRSILRPPMIERMLMTRLDRPDDFQAKIPAPMRAGTDPRQRKYLEEICGIIGRARAG